MAAADINVEASPVVVKVSAPGKVILHGEHSVVYGKRAVALSLDLRSHLILTTGGTSVSLDMPEVNIKESWTLDILKDLWCTLGRKKEDIATPLTPDQTVLVRKFAGITDEVTDARKLALLSFLVLYLGILPQPVPLNISVNSQLPIGAGLGSSAAYAVCLSGALLHISGHLDLYHESRPVEENRVEVSDNLKTVSQWAFISEQIVHGTPSGIDNSICTYGGAIDFKSGEISPIQIPPLQILLVNTRVPRSTKSLVSGVRERYERLPKVMQPILDSMDEVANQGVNVLQELASCGTDDKTSEPVYASLHELVNVNHALLCAIGVSHPSLDHIVSVARSHGLHAKLTGAGGGGFGIVVLGPATPAATINTCREELERAGYQVWTTCLGAPGFVVHDVLCPS